MEKNIEESARFLAGLPRKPERVDLLPYHDIGKGKHERLGTVYNNHNFILSTPTTEIINRCISQFQRNGINAETGG